MNLVTPKVRTSSNPLLRTGADLLLLYQCSYKGSNLEQGGLAAVALSSVSRRNL